MYRFRDVNREVVEGGWKDVLTPDGARKGIV
jgi:hypothetical protein